MKASILGADGSPLCQIPRLREGFASLGHEHTFDVHDPDTSFVFVGNPPYDDYLELTKEKKTIFNVLDLPFHVPEIGDIIARLKEQLPRASRVTTISHTVARQLREHCNVEAEVIYYPMKPVRYTGERKHPQFKAAMIGRVSDQNKRNNISISALIRAGFNESEVAIVGPERLPWGTYLGTVSDEVLSELYNSVDYVFMPSKNEGIGLTAIEAACCGAIPIVLPDLSTFDELWIQSPLGLNYQMLTNLTELVNLMRALESNQAWKNDVKQDVLAYAQLFFRPRFEAAVVAKRLIEVYQTI